MDKLTKDNALAHYVDFDQDKFLLMFKYSGDSKKKLIKCKLEKNIRLFALFEYILTRIDPSRKPKDAGAENGGNGTQRPMSIDILKRNGKSVNRNDTCRDTFKNRADLRLFVRDPVNNARSTYPLVYNFPFIESIELPQSLLVGYPVNPNKIKCKNTDLTVSECAWYRIVDADEIRVGDKYTYVPCEKDIGCRLKFRCCPKKFKKEGISCEITSKAVVERGPECPFEERHRLTDKKNNRNRFRVVSYNILDHATETSFPYCPSNVLQIDYRKQLILKELIGYNADIVCLQEVSIFLYFNDLLTTLSPLGYGVIFSAKGDSKFRGFACIYDKNRFRIVKSERFVLGVELKTNELLSDIYQEIRKVPELDEAICSKNTTVQVCVLESIENSCQIVVANTHLYWEPEAENIRLIQTGVLLKILEERCSVCDKAEFRDNIPIILCGDLNTGPESEIFNLITQGIRIPMLKDWSDDENILENMTFSHFLNLKSAYDKPKFTHYTHEFKGCLDYIFYNGAAFDSVRNVPLYTEEQLAKDVAIPSKVFPSDHVALVTDLTLV